MADLKRARNCFARLISGIQSKLMVRFLTRKVRENVSAVGSAKEYFLGNIEGKRNGSES